jgi:hypothetical protein
VSDGVIYLMKFLVVFTKSFMEYISCFIFGLVSFLFCDKNGGL